MSADDPHRLQSAFGHYSVVSPRSRSSHRRPFGGVISNAIVCLSLNVPHISCVGRFTSLRVSCDMAGRLCTGSCSVGARGPSEILSVLLQHWKLHSLCVGCMCAIFM